MKQKLFSMAAAAIVMCFVLSGCKMGETGTVGINPINQSGKESIENIGDDDKTITLALWDYDAEGSPYPAMIEGFKKDNPNIKVEIISSANADYDTKLSTMLAGGDDIDVFFGKSNTQYPTLVLKDYALPLDDLIASHNFDITSFGTILDRHYRLDGSLYALPFRTNDWVIFFNKKLFDEAGVPYPSNNMTWDEYRDMGNQVTSVNEGTINYGISFIPKTSFIVPALLGISDSFDITKNDYSVLKPAMEYLTGLQNEDECYEPYAESKSMNQDQTYFYKGTTAMLYNGSWFTQMLVANDAKISFDWGIVKQPYWEGMEQKGFATSTPILINKKTAYPEEAFALLTYMTGEEGAKILAETQLMPSYMTDEVMDIYRTSTGIDESSMEALTGNLVYSLGEPNVMMGIISDMMNEELELYITGNQTVDETIAHMEQRRMELLLQNQ